MNDKYGSIVTVSSWKNEQVRLEERFLGQGIQYESNKSNLQNMTLQYDLGLMLGKGI